MAVVEYDLTFDLIRQVGVIMESRNSGIFNDHAGQLLQTSGGDWQLLNSTWGNGFGGVIKVRRVLTSTDISEGSHVVSSSDLAIPNVPGGTGGAYDPCAIKIGSEWWVGYSVVDPTSFVGENFYPALAKTSDWSTWTAIGVDTSNTKNEGTRLLLTNSADLWLITGGRGEQGIYDDTMTLIDSSLTVDVALYNGTDTQPWVSIIPWGDEWLALTFDNTKGTAGVAFTWGNLWLYRAPRYV
jgi:hypothetical protein